MAKRKAPAFAKSKAMKIAKAPKISTGLYGKGKLRRMLKSMGVLR